MPLSEAMATFDRHALRPAARAAFGVDDDTFLLVVNGGSQGSARLNDVAVGLAERWRDRDGLRIVVKAGTAHVDHVQEVLAAKGLLGIASVVGYFDSIEHSYAAADMALTRGGAGTVSELTVAGVPAIVVPYPYARPRIIRPSTPASSPMQGRR